ncbi:ATP-dependent Clp protease adaptor ClpS [Massilia aquatica]|uniref:ATP-dependent Clp protease adapter protein ClpS n=1 Tax=Massilia aquatica TaxID=2609000 RepID=A0ABX0M6F6_9BURK|nr:ATP-dependent Clp protease adaptor ClpS [Massilia aquatica]NHZ42778.1 ATP-dependent Clp protease adaptor ClpS [Massilia aquatica]
MSIADGDPAPNLERVLESAFAACRREHDRRLTLERVLLHLIEDDAAAHILADCMPAGKVAQLHAHVRAMVADQLAAEAKARRWPTGAHARLLALLAHCLPFGNARLDAYLGRTIAHGEQLEHALWKATVRGVAMERPVDTGILLLAIVRNRIGLAAVALEEHGLDRYRLACRLAYGAADTGSVDALLAGSETARLLVLNDDVTEMVFVVEVFETLLALPADRANALMMQIHDEGEAECGVFPLAVARARVKDIEALAGERCQPLRVRLAAPRPSA